VWLKATVQFGLPSVIGSLNHKVLKCGNHGFICRDGISIRLLKMIGSLWKLSVNNAVICSKEAVQFSADFVTSLFASFRRDLRNGNEFCIFIVRIKLITFENTPLDLSSILVLFVIN